MLETLLNIKYYQNYPKVVGVKGGRKSNHVKNKVYVKQGFNSIFDKEIDAETILNRIQLRSPDAMHQGWNTFWVNPWSKAMDFLQM